MKRFFEKNNVLFLSNVDGKTGKEWDVVLIESGLSLNKKFYSKELLENSVSVFEGVKCCAFLEGDDFNHRDQGNAARNQSGPALNTIGFFENARFEEFTKADGSKGHGIVARLKVFDGKEQIMETMKDAFKSGKTDLFGFSIDAHGEVREGFIEGQEALIVESITQVESTDFVNHPSAGGQFLRIAAKNDKKGESMKNFKKLAEKLGLNQNDGESDDDFEKRVLEHKIAESKENPLGSFIRQISEEKGISTTEIAEAAGFDKMMLKKIMDGDIKRPPDERLKKMAKSLGISFDEILNKIPESVRETVDGAFITEQETELEMKTAQEIKEAQEKLEKEQADFAEKQKVSNIKESQLLVKGLLLESDLPELAKKKITEKFDGQEEVTKETVETAIKEEKAYINSLKENKTGDVDGLGDAHDNDTGVDTRTKVGDSLKEKLAKAWDGMYEMEDIDGVARFNTLKEAWRAYNKGNLKALSGSDEQMSRHIFESMARGLPGESALTWDQGNPYEAHSNKLRESWKRRTSESLRESTATGDFSVGFGDSLYRRLQKETTMDPRSDWRKIVSSIENLKDSSNPFRVVRTGESKRLPVVAEKAPYQEINPSTAEEVESMTPAKYGGLEIVSWEAVLADNMGIIRKVPRKLARAANMTIHGLIWDEIELNPTMQDSVALFHADHANEIGDVALSYANVVVGVNKLRQQTAFESAEKMGLNPHFLLTSLNQEALGEEIIGSTVKATSAEDSTINNVLMTKFRMKALGTLGLGTAAARILYWYICASPKDADTIAVGFLGGRDRPDLFVQGVDTPTSGSMFDADMITYKIRQVAAATIVDHRWIQRAAKS